MSTGFNDDRFDDDNFDWTNGDQGGAPVAAVADALDFVVPSTSASTDADQTEREAEDSKFQAPPPGNYLFEVAGFLKPPEQITKTGYIGSQSVAYKPYKVAMKLRVVGSPNFTMLDNLELPPADDAGKKAFQRSTKNPNGDARSAGFMNKKYEHLIKKLGWNFASGEAIPAEALGLRNWVGRKLYANVTLGKQQIDPVTQQPKIDPGTGLPYPARPQIELFSYRESEATVVGQQGGQGGGQQPGRPGQAGPPHGQRPASPSGQPARPVANPGAKAPPGTHARSFMEAGLNNV